MRVLRGAAAVFAATISLTLPSELLAGGEWRDGQRSVAGADYAPGQPPDNKPNNWPYQPPLKREWPDGPNKEYLKNLQRPDNWKNPYRRLGDGRSLSCCDVGDAVKTKFKVEAAGNSELGNHPEDRWYAWINGEWVLVPPDKIVPDHAPDGTPYLFMMVGKIQCFSFARAERAMSGRKAGDASPAQRVLSWRTCHATILATVSLAAARFKL